MLAADAPTPREDRIRGVTFAMVISNEAMPVNLRRTPSTTLTSERQARA